MNPKEIIVSIITAMAVVAMFAPSAMAINVDGLVSPSNEWNGDWLKDDPCTTETHGMGPWGYNLEALYQHYDEPTDTLYFRLDVCGIPADLDGDGNTGVDGSPVPPGDWDGVGQYEQYTIILTDNTYTTGKPGALLYYSDNTVLHADGFAAWGTDCVEFSLTDASDYVDPRDYCIKVTAGGSTDEPYSEDIMNVCYRDSPPNAVCTFTPDTCGQGTLDASASTDDVGIVKYAWDFCDGVTGDYDDAYGVSVTYTDIGTCNVGLKVTDTAGQTNTTRLDVTLTGDPVAIAKADGADSVQLPVSGKTVTFCGDESYHPYSADGASIVSYDWTILGVTYSTTDPNECFDVFINETTTACLTVTDNYGCTATDCVGLRKPPAQEVPVLTPAGMLALIGMLCIVGAGRIITKGRRL